MDWSKELLKHISMYDVYKGFEDSEVYQKLCQIGNELYPATQYQNAFVVEKDPFASAVLKIVSVSYHLGVASFIQTEHALFWNKNSNLEYPYAITLRSMIELAGRVHKGIKLYKTYKQNQDREAFINGCGRLTASFVPGSNGSGGYNIMTLVESLDDAIPNIREEYDRISDYLHGLFMYHAAFRNITYLHSMPGYTEDSTFEEVMADIKTPRKSPVIDMHDPLVESLRGALFEDLEVAQKLAKPFAERYLLSLEKK